MQYTIEVLNTHANTYITSMQYTIHEVFTGFCIVLVPKSQNESQI
mgnify:CR=1 FL=1